MKLRAILKIAEQYKELDPKTIELLQYLEMGAATERGLDMFPFKNVIQAQSFILGVSYASEAIDTAFREVRIIQKLLHGFIEKKHNRTK